MTLAKISVIRGEEISDGILAQPEGGDKTHYSSVSPK